MKKRLLLVLVTVLFSVSLCAQNESSVLCDGSSYNFIFSWKKKATKAHWTGFGFAFSNLEGLEEVDLKRNRSYSVILNIGDYIVPLDHHWLLATGLGFD